MVPAIVACEIGFWLLLGAGLWARYGLRRPRAGAVLLALTPVVDLVLLVLATIDLSRGATADNSHALAAVYIGVSVAFGPRILAWADARFAYRFAGAPAPVKPPRGGPERARRERAGWLRHALAWAIGCSLLAAGIVLTGDSARTEALWGMAQIWTVVLVIDLLWSLSYTVFPKRAA